MNSHVRTVFTKVPQTYELVNHILTLGLDIVWRKKVARIAARLGGERWADMCTGTGETAAYLARRAPEGTKVYGLDFSEPMLEIARKKPEADRIHFQVCDARALPFPDDHFDLMTISFGTRNLNVDRATLVRTFAEFRRVLKPGGIFINLETTQPPLKLLRFGRDMFVRLLVRPVGAAISGQKPAYVYLSKTIRQFYTCPELSDMLKEAGFSSVSAQYLLLGISAIHRAVK